jgi:nucleoside-diphosphate-sugar epimerase
MTVRELAELIIEMTGHTAGIEYKPHFIEDHHNRLPSVEKVSALGWQQEVSIRDGLERMAQDVRSRTAARV